MSASTITPKQQSLVRTLLEERVEVLGIVDLDAYITSQGINILTGQGASKLIDALLAITIGKKSEHSHLPDGRVIVNKFAKGCALCGGLVEAGNGHAVQTSEGWKTYHRLNECGAPSTSNGTVVEPKRAYRLEDGTIAIGYLTQNRRVAVRRLVIHEDGTGSLEYWAGGTAHVRATGTPLSQEEASSLGKTYGFCVCCGKALSEDQSLAVGYGATCAGNNGWWYPTAKEARDILARPTSV